MLCERCGEEIPEEDFEARVRGLDYDYDILCEECYNSLEEGEGEEY